jgi:hypothetical protein
VGALLVLLLLPAELSVVELLLVLLMRQLLLASSVEVRLLLAL